VVIHKITIDDTLEGLSIQYGVSPNVIKTYNNLTSDSIYYLKEIKIPNPTDYYENKVLF
jgi:LysM repeat protein